MVSLSWISSACSSNPGPSKQPLMASFQAMEMERLSRTWSPIVSRPSRATQSIETIPDFWRFGASMWVLLFAFFRNWLPTDCDPTLPMWCSWMRREILIAFSEKLKRMRFALVNLYFMNHLPCFLKQKGSCLMRVWFTKLGFRGLPALLSLSLSSTNPPKKKKSSSHISICIYQQLSPRYLTLWFVTGY